MGHKALLCQQIKQKQWRRLQALKKHDPYVKEGGISSYDVCLERPNAFSSKKGWLGKDVTKPTIVKSQPLNRLKDKPVVESLWNKKDPKSRSKRKAEFPQRKIRWCQTTPKTSENEKKRHGQPTFNLDHAYLKASWHVFPVDQKQILKTLPFGVGMFKKSKTRLNITVVNMMKRNIIRFKWNFKA